MQRHHESRGPFTQFVHPATVLWTHTPGGRRDRALAPGRPRRSIARLAGMVAIAASVVGFLLAADSDPGDPRRQGGGDARTAPASIAGAG